MTHTAQPTRVLPLALLLSVLALGGFANAQAPASARVGYVDMKRLLDNAPQVVAGRQKLEREFAARDAALKGDEKQAAELHERQQRSASTMGAAEATALQREIDALDRSIKRNRDTLRNDLKTRSDQELDQSWRDINDAVVEFARDQGFDLIVPSPVIYASPKVDVTERILDRLRHRPARSPAP